MKKIFIPYYINQDRLFDLYSILNDGYSEYEEITAGTTSDVGAKAKLGSGIKFMRIEGDVEGKKNSQTGKKEKKVQTLASMLHIVLEQLEEEKHIYSIDAAKTGSFICLPVTMKLNSLNEFIYETSKIIEMSKKIEKLGENKKKTSPLSSDERQIKDLLEITKLLKVEKNCCLKPMSMH